MTLKREDGNGELVLRGRDVSVETLSVTTNTD
jgi:hypothetical protein